MPAAFIWLKPFLWASPVSMASPFGGFYGLKPVSMAAPFQVSGSIVQCSKVLVESRHGTIVQDGGLRPFQGFMVQCLRRFKFKVSRLRVQCSKI